MDFGALPPEVNSARMYAGPGASSLLASTAAWQALAVELNVAAAGYATVITDLSASWTGVSSSTAIATLVTYSRWLTTTATQASQTATATQSVATAYQTAKTATVPPTVVASNRSQVLMLTALNILGQYTAMIATLEMQYAQMWAQDVAAMSTYAASAQSATETLTPIASPQADATTTPTTPDLSPTGWIGQIILSLISSGPYVVPMEILSLLTGLWAVSTVAAVPDVLNHIRNEIAMTPTVAPTLPVVKAPEVTAQTGAGQRIGRLAAPPNWARPPEERQPRTPLVIPHDIDHPVPLPIPLPMPIGTGQRNGERKPKPDPEYGWAPKVVPGSPAGG